MIIYKTTNLINRKIYIGMDSRNNPLYLGSGHILQLALKKYGRNNFKKEILEICDLNNIYEREIFWIKFLNARNKKIGYNLVDGGPGTLGYHHTSEAKKKIGVITSKALRGRKIPENVRIKMSINNGYSMLGKHHTKKSKFLNRIHQPWLGKKIPEERRKRLSSNACWLGKHLPLEIRQKISASLTGHRVSSETKNKLSIIKSGTHHSAITKNKISKANKGQIPWISGRHHSNYTRKQLSINNARYWLGKHFSPEQKLKMSIAAKNRNRFK